MKYLKLLKSVELLITHKTSVELTLGDPFALCSPRRDVPARSLWLRLHSRSSGKNSDNILYHIRVEGTMGWAEVVGKLPATLLTLVAAIACATFIALVGVTLWSIFYTGVPIQIANYEFGSVVAPPPPAIPAGAVVAFENYDPDRCPPGWEPSLPTRGRLILGAGDAKVQTNRLSIDERGKALKNFALLQHGGDLARINFKDLASDQPITPYENMLPWVALTFCKKK
jgi:hypothetical protein